MWQDLEEWLCLHDRNPLSSCNSCPSHNCDGSPRWGKVAVACPQFVEAQRITYNAKRPAIEELLSCIWQDTQVSMSAWQNPVEQLSLLCLSIIAIAAQDGANRKLSPAWSPKNHIHCKTSCYRSIVMHLTRHSGITAKSRWAAVAPVLVNNCDCSQRWGKLEVVPSLKPKESHTS